MRTNGNEPSQIMPRTDQCEIPKKAAAPLIDNKRGSASFPSCFISNSSLSRKSSEKLRRRDRSQSPIPHIPQNSAHEVLTVIFCGCTLLKTRNLFRYISRLGYGYSRNQILADFRYTDGLSSAKFPDAFCSGHRVMIHGRATEFLCGDFPGQFCVRIRSVVT